MWPKALSQLIELAPHINRLLPLADRFFKDKAVGEEATRQAVDGQRSAIEAQRASLLDLSDRLHADIGALAAAQVTQAASLERQVAEMERYLGTARADALAAKQATEGLDARLTRIEASQKQTQTLALVALLLLVALLVLVAVLFLRAH